MVAIGKPKTTKARKDYQMDDPMAIEDESIEAIKKARAKADAKREAVLIAKELGRELRNQPKEKNKRKNKKTYEFGAERKGGGKVHSSKYTSGNKRYANGGKIYPMVGK